MKFSPPCRTLPRKARTFSPSGNTSSRRAITCPSFDMSILTSFPNTSSWERQWASSTSKPARWYAPPTTPSIRQNPRTSRAVTPILSPAHWRIAGLHSRQWMVAPSMGRSDAPIVKRLGTPPADDGRYHALEALVVCLGIVEHELRSESHVQFVDGLDAVDQSLVCEITPRTL